MSDSRGPWGPLAEPMHTDRVFSPDDPPWRENLFLTLYDRERGLYGTTHLQGGRTDAGMWARCSVVVDKRPAEIWERLNPMTFESEHISFDLGGHLEAKSDDFELHLDLSPLREAIDYSPSGALPGLRPNEPLQHFEQAGTLTGTVTMGSTTLQLSGGVVRDRTWGFRQEISSWTEYYAGFFLFDDFDLATMKFQTLDGDIPAHGQLVGSRNESVADATVRRRDPWGNIAELDLVLDNGSPLSLSLGKPEARINCPLNDPTGPVAFTSYDDLVEVRTSDGDVGFGIIEQGILRRQA
ncbi:MAG: hypothetical protein QOD82_1888 [Pseudonocardiales bacterium]|nr:hypothetical protein [Pseudonocardiales bacterium]